MSTFIEVCLCILMGSASLMGLIALAVMTINFKRDYIDKK
jgi:hypothetical protein